MDVGIDDALAILYLANAGAELVALGSVHGNCDADTAASNALRVLATCGLPRVPVAIGSRKPLVGEASFSSEVHGDDGLGGVAATAMARPELGPTAEAAWDQLVRLGRERPGELDLLAVGPLTNLARAIEIDPDVLRRYRRVVVMGGSGTRTAPGTVLELDWNIIHDPEAAQMVFAGAENIAMVGVNVTSPTVLAGSDLDRIARSTTVTGRAAWAILEFYLGFYATYSAQPWCSLHDPLAAGILLDDAYVLEAETGPVEVRRQGPYARAILVPGGGGPDVRVIKKVDGPGFARAFSEGIASSTDRFSAADTAG
jgi:purine nucleosidase